MDVQLIQVPYFLGHENMSSGRGPEYLIERGANRALREKGHRVTVRRITAPDRPLTTEIGRSFDLYRLLAGAVRSALQSERLPVVLAGNCGSCTGTIAGIGLNDLGIIWFDSHGDFNTPDTTISGFFDGMGLAMATGRGWASLMQTLPGFVPVRDAHVVHIGARDLDAAEEALLRESDVQLVSITDVGLPAMPQAIEAALNELAGRVRRVYIHVDVDVLETGRAKANWLGAPGGLPVEEVIAAIERAKDLFTLEACALASFDPEYDRDDIVLGAALSIIEALVS
jgi:arginase